MLILGSGIAGLRAAIEASRVSAGRADVAVITKVQAMRSHSVSAEGGTAAVLYPEEGDSFESHAYDTVKGSDFLADQDTVDRLVTMMPEEIYQLEHWGMPWSRRPDGRIAQRHFGGYSFPRAVFASDRVGFFEMQTLYDTALRYENITFYQEWFATSLIAEDGRFEGLTAIELKTGDFYAFKGKSCVIATGGAGRLYSFATYGHSSTPDGLAIAYRAGIPIKDMEFVQFHPTGLVPSGILITEGARGDGAILLNKEGERFMKRYAPQKLDLAARDVVSRAMITEIKEGRGYEGSGGLDYIHLDMRHLGAETIKERLSGIREISIKFSGRDPVEEPLPVRPVCHYTMGGIDTDIDGATRVQGVWSAGEAACVSVNGANRMGANSTAECLVWGRITGARAAEFARSNNGLAINTEKVAAEEKRIFDGLLRGVGSENPYNLKLELQTLMDRHAYVFRSGDGLTEAIKHFRELKNRAFRHVEDKSREYNTNLTNVLELEGMLEIAEVILVGANTRTESRGAHWRLDYPTRNDKEWLKHTLAFYTPAGPRLDYAPVTITRYVPEERKY